MPVKVVFYTRPGCHLCQDAHRILDELGRDLPVEVETVNIDDSPELVARYGDRVPVIAVDGRDRLWGRINRAMLRRVLVGLV